MTAIPRKAHICLVFWSDLEACFTPYDPHPHIGLKEKTRINGMPRYYMVYSREIEILKKLYTLDEKKISLRFEETYLNKYLV